MAIYDYPRIRYNTVAGVLEMNIGFENWVTIPLGIVPGEIVLANSKLLIGGVDGIAAAQTLSGDATVTNAGVVTVANVLRLTGGTITPASNGLTTLLVTRADGTTKVFDVDTTNSKVLIGTSDPDTGAILTLSKTDGSGNTVRARVQNQSANGLSEWEAFNDVGGFLSTGIGGSTLSSAFASQPYVWANNNGVMLLATGTSQQVLFNFNVAAAAGTKAKVDSTGTFSTEGSVNFTSSGVVQSHLDNVSGGIDLVTNSTGSEAGWNFRADGSLGLPLLSDAQRDAIPTPQEGLFIYNVTTHTLNFYNGSAWRQVTNSAV